MMRRARGFTLLETLLVVALLAIAAVLATGAITGGLRGSELRATAKAIAADLRFTRARAIATGRRQAFTLDVEARTWRAPDGRDGEVPPRLSVEFTGAREVQVARSEGSVVFFPDGAATGGRVRLSLDGASWDVDVAWLTGEVTVSRGGPADG